MPVTLPIEGDDPNPQFRNLPKLLEREKRSNCDRLQPGNSAIDCCRTRCFVPNCSRANANVTANVVCDASKASNQSVSTWKILRQYCTYGRHFRHWRCLFREFHNQCLSRWCDKIASASCQKMLECALFIPCLQLRPALASSPPARQWWRIG